MIPSGDEPGLTDFHHINKICFLKWADNIRVL